MAAGKRVAFTAASGGVGTLALQLARLWGIKSLATTRRAGKLPALEALASEARQVRKPDELMAALLAFDARAGVDAVIDPLGGDYIAAALAGLARGGSVVSYEMVTGAAAAFDIMSLMMKDASLHGFTVFRLMQRPEVLTQLIGDGLALAQRLRPTIGAFYPFYEAPAALQALARGDHVGKIVIEV